MNRDVESERTRNIYPRRSDKVHIEMQTGAFLKGLQHDRASCHTKSNFTHVQAEWMVCGPHREELTAEFVAQPLTHNSHNPHHFLCVVNYAPVHVLF